MTAHEDSEQGQVRLACARWVDSRSNDFLKRSCETLREIRQKRWERDAERYLRELLEAGPSEAHDWATFLLWALLAGREDRDPSRELWLRAAILDRPLSHLPEIWGGAWFELGYFLFLGGEESAAEAPLRHAVECGHPDVVDQALYYLGMVLTGLGREPEAEAVWREATKWGEPFGVHAQRELGLLLASQENRMREAEAALRQAIAADSYDKTLSLCNLGILLASEQGREEEAEQVLREAIDSADLRHEAYFASRASAHLERLLSGKPPRRVIVRGSGEEPVHRRRDE